MKLILSGILALSISTPVLAQHNHHHRHHGNNNWIGPAVIGAIGAAIVIDQYGRRSPVLVDPSGHVVISSDPPILAVPNYPVSPVCHSWREVLDINGNIYRERICRN